MPIPRIILKPGKEQPLLRKHLWVFSGAIDRVDPKPTDGDVVHVLDSKGNPLATGHYQDGSITVRVISFDLLDPDVAFWTQRLQSALKYREGLGMTQDPDTNAFRLIHAEGDGLPGLVVDVFNDVAVVQTHSAGMRRAVTQIAQGVTSTLGKKVDSVYHRDAEAGKGTLLWGEKKQTIITENGRKFHVDVESGQKTGYFLDQRENRQFVSGFMKDKSVLDAFSYAGGFAVYALSAGARHVDLVDTSSRAMALVDANMGLNGLGNFEVRTADVTEHLRSTGEYDVIILDPPAFAKSRAAERAALKRYRSVNADAMRHVAKGGMLFSFSCSQHVDREAFEHVIQAAAIEVGRDMRVFHRFGQPADHPVNVCHPEVEYLKGVALVLD
jgi:23S rRNA (cytosine1962-C5)-methyltransferase